MNPYALRSMSDRQCEVLATVLTNRTFQNLIGGEGWTLTEPEEMDLWTIIKMVSNPRR